MKRPVRVAVTGAAGQIGYSLLFRIASGAMWVDMRAVGVDIVTLGQYLRPSDQHLPVVRWWHPEEFATLGRYAESLGFAHVEAGPLVRSSYHAKRMLFSSCTRAMVTRQHLFFYPLMAFARWNLYFQGVCGLVQGRRTLAAAAEACEWSTTKKCCCLRFK